MINNETRFSKVIHSTVYRYGSPCDQFYGYLVLREGGGVYGYDHPNEKQWCFNSEELAFISEIGLVTSCFKYEPTTNCFFGKAFGTQWPLCLIPILSLDAGTTSGSLPPLIINTIPKAGTYFLEAAFAYAGWLATRLHLGSHQIDDYRTSADDDMHKTPEKCRINCPVDIFAAALPLGHLAVGHVEDSKMINQVRKLGIPLIHCVRNLRNVIVSLYRFKRAKVQPIDAPDLYWRKLPESSAFDGFITVLSNRDMAFIADMARLIVQDTEAVTLRYEDLIQGRICQKVEMLTHDSSILRHIREGLLAKLGHPTSTLSGSERSDWKSVWTPFAEDFFVQSGLLELNQALGYE